MVVIRTKLPAAGILCTKAIANVISSAGVFEVIRIGNEEGDNVDVFGT